MARLFYFWHYYPIRTIAVLGSITLTLASFLFWVIIEPSPFIKRTSFYQSIITPLHEQPDRTIPLSSSDLQQKLTQESVLVASNLGIPLASGTVDASIVSSSLLLLDIRPKGSFTTQHIKGAHNIPLDSLGKISIDNSHIVYVYGESDTQLKEASSILHAKGVKTVYLIKSPIQQLKQSNITVETGAEVYGR